MKEKRFLSGIPAMALLFGIAVLAGCGGGSDETPPYVPPSTPLTGTVTVSKNVALNTTILGRETMTLTADTSGLNGTSDTYYFYQWQRDGADINDARSKTYDVREADYGKTLKVKVTHSVYSGEQFGQFEVPSPTIMNVSVKYDASTTSTDRKSVIFERADGSSFGASTSTSLGTTAETVTLYSWSETKFKMRIAYTTYGGNGSPDVKYYFKKSDTTVEEFELINGSKTYTLKFVYSGGTYTNLSATEG